MALPSLGHMSGTEVWSASRIRAWLTAPLRDTAAVWTTNPDRTWAEIGGDLLRGLGLRDAADFPVVEQLFDHVARLSTEEQRRAFVLHEAARDEVIAGFAEQYERDHPPEPYWDEEGQRYLRWDATTGTWVPLEAGPSAAVPEPRWDEESQRYLHWDSTTG